MRLFTHKASESSNRQTHARGDRSAINRLANAAKPMRPTDRSLFEPLETRQMMSVSPALPTTLIPLKNTPAFEKAIDQEYQNTFSETDALGFNVGSRLGNPTSGFNNVPGNNLAVMETFHDNGAIYWSASTGAHVVYGAIGAEYAALAHETDANGNNVQLLIGLPTSDETNIPGVAGGRETTFQNGSIVWSAGTGAHVVYGQIGALYNQMGGTSSYLGLSTSDESGPTNYRVVNFQSGFITWNPGLGAVAHETAVSVTTRYGNELVVTADGVHDEVTVDQENATTLTIVGDGQTFTEPLPAGGLFIYTRSGNDLIDIGHRVSSQTTVDTIDNSPTDVLAYNPHVIVWADTGDTVTGTSDVHYVSAFAGGVSKAPGASLANPTDSGATVTLNAPLFGTGPVPSDIVQGDDGDCWFLATLAAFAKVQPTLIENSVLDMGDGTYAVEYYNNGTPEYVRVNNQFPLNSNGYIFARPGATGNIWAMVMEKAECYFRTAANADQNSYISINDGGMSEAFSDLNVASVGGDPFNMSDNQFFDEVQNDERNGDAVTLGTLSSGAPDLPSHHIITLLDAEVINGVDYYTVRDPYGVSETPIENSQGIATLTYAQLVNNFNWMQEET